MITEVHESPDMESRLGDFPDAEENREVSERAFRLRQAVKASGGNQAVATRAGVHLGTLNRYIAGRDMKASSMVKLAIACGVSLDWLASGRGPMRPTASSAEGAAPPPAPPPPAPPPARPDDRGLFNSIHIDKLAGCIEAAQDEFARRQQTPPMRRVLQVALVLYDALEAQDAEAKAAKPP